MFQFKKKSFLLCILRLTRQEYLFGSPGTTHTNEGNGLFNTEIIGMKIKICITIDPPRKRPGRKPVLNVSELVSLI